MNHICLQIPVSLPVSIGRRCIRMVQVTSHETHNKSPESQDTCDGIGQLPTEPCCVKPRSDLDALFSWQSASCTSKLALGLLLAADWWSGCSAGTALAGRWQGDRWCSWPCSRLACSASAATCNACHSQLNTFTIVAMNSIHCNAIALIDCWAARASWLWLIKAPGAPSLR